MSTDQRRSTPLAHDSSSLPDEHSSGSTYGQELRVLLVDDHDDILTMMNLMMKRRSYEVATANSAHQAMKVMASFSPHVIVSDIGMPEIDGYQMMTALRSMDQLMPFKSIALTGYDVNPDQDQARAAGYDVHLTKPIDFNVLFAMIDELATSIKSIEMQQSKATEDEETA